MEFSVRLRESAQEVRGLERQRAINPTNLGHYCEPTETRAGERVIEQRKIGQSNARVIDSEQAAKFAHRVAIGARLPGRLHQLRPKRQVRVAETIVDVIVF